MIELEALIHKEALPVLVAHAKKKQIVLRNSTVLSESLSGRRNGFVLLLILRLGPDQKDGR